MAAFLLYDEEWRSLFVLPLPRGALIAALAAGLAWWIASRGRRRPGRIWPRLWALFLAGLNSLTTAVALLLPGRSWPLALAVAGLAAALTLAPRLVPLRPDSAMLQRVTPLSVLGVLLLILPLSCAAGNGIVGKRRHDVERKIDQLQLWTAEVQQVAGYDWSGMEDDPEGARKMVDRLERLSFAGEVGDPALWESAVTLGLDEELAARARELMDAVVAAFEPERVPRISTLREPAVRWDPEAKQWEAYSAFPRLSGITGAYHAQMGRLAAELDPGEVRAGSAGLVNLDLHYQTKEKELQAHLRQIAGTWTDNWAVFEVPRHKELIGRTEVSLADVLRAPFAASADGRQEQLVAGDLWRLIALPLAEVRRLTGHAPGCRPVEYEELEADGLHEFLPPRLLLLCAAEGGNRRPTAHRNEIGL